MQQHNPFDLFIKTEENAMLHTEWTYKEVEQDLGIYHIHITSKEPIHYSPVELQFRYPLSKIHYNWRPTYDKKVPYLYPDFHQGFTSNGASNAPISAFFGDDGINQFTCAFSEALNSLQMRLGVNEETGFVSSNCLLFADPLPKMTSYSLQLRVDTRKKMYHESIKDVATWWSTFENMIPASAPTCAKDPMYSTWYSYHQELFEDELEAQCQMAQELGCEAIIVDDGWQTDDTQRGYAFTGDWDVSTNRIKDMAAHVSRVHDLGLKYLLWYSVPYLGFASKNWDNYKDYILYRRDDFKCAILDPRYKEVRDFLINTYKKALTNWNLDGFKLDFIAKFSMAPPEALAVKEGMDHDSLQDAIDTLMTDVMSSLSTLKPDIMIEFRQPYIGPYMRKYGNILRVYDCPGDALSNRISLANIRLICGQTVPHSDMIMWNKEDTVESAALQMANTLFGVPQFSMKIEELHEDHKKMCKHYLSFYKNHKDILLDGVFYPLYPQLNYPILKSHSNTHDIFGVYGDMAVDIDTGVTETTLVNGKLSQSLLLRFDESSHYTLSITNCMGENLQSEDVFFSKGVVEIEVPPCGMIHLKH